MTHARDERARLEASVREAAARAQRAAEASRILEAERRRRARRESYAALAIRAGVVTTRAEYDRLSDREIDEIAAATELSDLLHADLVRASEESANAEKNLQSERSIAAAASMLGVLTDCVWAAWGFGLWSVSASAVSDDWKRHRAARYRDKWSDLFRSLTPQERLLVTRLFRHRHAASAAMIARTLGGDAPRA